MSLLFSGFSCHYCSQALACYSCRKIAATYGLDKALVKVYPNAFLTSYTRVIAKLDLAIQRYAAGIFWIPRSSLGMTVRGGWYGVGNQ